MQLSACIIARNEEGRIAQAISSVRDVADEVVVTDTGSTDQTARQAQELGVRVCHFPWVDDFSAAYNHCIDQANGDWILQLDADEELLPESIETVRCCISNPAALAYTVLRRDVYGTSTADDYTKMLHVRLFRNRPDLRFVGRIHHKFITPLHVIAERENLQVLPSNIELLHHGYVGNNQAAKLSRAAHLMGLELRDRPGQFYYLVELGRTWLKMRDARSVELITQAAQIVKEDLDRALECRGILATLLEHVLACDSLPPGFPLSHADATTLTLEHFPSAVPLIWQLALRAFKAGDYERSAELLERIIDLGKTENYDKHYSFQPDIMRGDAVLNLGVCYANLGRLGPARRCFQKLVYDAKYKDRAVKNLAALKQMLK